MIPEIMIWTENKSQTFNQRNHPGTPSDSFLRNRVRQKTRCMTQDLGLNDSAISLFFFLSARPLALGEPNCHVLRNSGSLWRGSHGAKLRCLANVWWEGPTWVGLEMLNTALEGSGTHPLSKTQPERVLLDSWTTGTMGWYVCCYKLLSFGVIYHIAKDKLICLLSFRNNWAFTIVSVNITWVQGIFYLGKHSRTQGLPIFHKVGIYRHSVVTCLHALLILWTLERETC